MTPGGWVLMLAAVGGVTAFLSWCIWKVLATPGESEHVHSPADIETPDRRDD
jgi:hypothetical protein